MGRLGFCACIAFLAVLFTPGLAQRPANASLCDYYAQARYGANNSETQLKFIQNVVCLAFEGGTRLNNVSSEITGILRPGKFNGQNVDLQQFFNGSKQSTNVNNAAATVNWLDQGGTQPLAAFLAGESQTLNIANSSNQYRLFGNFFVAFSRAFGCTLPPPPPGTGNGPVSLAYAHKFMNLEYHQLGYFINHLALSAVHFGMSPQDADTFRTRLNSQYNVRCAPAVSFNPSSPPQLLSLCQNPTCPLAVPVSDCAAYNNLTANGIVDSKPTTVTNTATLTATPTGNAATGSSSPPPAAAPHSDKLSTGGIAGVAIGGAAVLLIAIIALIYFLRRRKSNAAPAPDHGPVSAWDQNNYGSPTIHPSSTYSPKNPHSSYYSTGQPASEMDTSRYQNLVDATSPVATPDPTAQQYRPYSGHPNDIYAPPPVEMDGTHRGSPPPVHNAVWSDQHRHSGVNTPVQSHEQYAQHEPWSAPHRQAGV